MNEIINGYKDMIFKLQSICRMYTISHLRTIPVTFAVHTSGDIRFTFNEKYKDHYNVNDLLEKLKNSELNDSFVIEKFDRYIIDMRLRT